jgi:hypothetical protein
MAFIYVATTKTQKVLPRKMEFECPLTARPVSPDSDWDFGILTM